MDRGLRDRAAGPADPHHPLLPGQPVPLSRLQLIGEQSCWLGNRSSDTAGEKLVGPDEGAGFCKPLPLRCHCPVPSGQVPQVPLQPPGVETRGGFQGSDPERWVSRMECLPWALCFPWRDRRLSGASAWCCRGGGGGGACCYFSDPFDTVCLGLRGAGVLWAHPHVPGFSQRVLKTSGNDLCGHLVTSPPFLLLCSRCGYLQVSKLTSSGPLYLLCPLPGTLGSSSLPISCLFFGSQLGCHLLREAFPAS